MTWMMIYILIIRFKWTKNSLVEVNINRVTSDTDDDDLNTNKKTNDLDNKDDISINKKNTDTDNDEININ